MYLIQKITDDALQQQSVVLYNGNTMTFTMYYSESQQGWFITSLVYGSFVLNGIRVVVSPNMLNQYRNIIPFGLGCFTTLLREPTLIQDFSSNNFNFYILNAEEVNTYNNLLTQGPSNVAA